MVTFQEFEQNVASLKGKRKEINTATLTLLFCQLRDSLRPWSRKQERMMNIMISWFFFRPDIDLPDRHAEPPFEDGIARHWREEAEDICPKK